MRFLKILFIYLAGAALGSACLAAVPTAREAPRTLVRVSPRLDFAAGCELTLGAVTDTAQRGLRRGRARWGAGYLGAYAELETLLLQAGLNSERTRHAVRGLGQVLDLEWPDPSMRFTAARLSRLADAGRLMVCVLTAECSMTTTTRVEALYSDDPAHAVAMVPLATQPAAEFAADFLAGFSGLAADRLYHLWCDAISPRIEAGDFDHYAHRAGFETMLRTLFMLHQRTLIEQAFVPSSTPESRRRMIHETYRRLTEGSASGVMPGLVIDLGLTEDNLIPTAQHLIDEIFAVIKRAR